MNEDKIKSLLFQGKTNAEIAKMFSIQTSTVSAIKGQLNLPSAKIITKILNHPTFIDDFSNYYNSTKDLKSIYSYLKTFDFFKRTPYIEKRFSEVRSLLKLPCKMPENTYHSDNDRIRGYIIRNSKFMAKRRNIDFNLKYIDFEIPEYCPILNIKLKYMSESNGNSYDHATLDRIDNSKGYIKGNVIVISRLANAMKNQANFDQLELFSKNIMLLINFYKNQGALGSITDVFGHFTHKLSLDY